MDIVERIHEKQQADEKLALDAAALAGHILLESGAEIFRVEETIKRVANAYGMKGEGAFVLSSGIFLTEESHKHGFYANVKHIPLSGVHLDKVAAVNQLSREIENGMHTPAEALEKLNEIKSMPEKPKLAQMLATGVGSGCFCYLFGGSVFDGMTSFLVGCILCMYLSVVGKRKKRTSKIVVNITSGMLVTALSILFYLCGIGESLNHIVIGSIIPLVPGVAFTNAIRDIASEDYISGTVRIVDVVLVAFSIAMGVGLVYTIFSRMVGGIVLW
ncbi:MAG: threonine/serine exporter family protein [Lachnospiraceae bacterium]|nr:threonine/serine exporter family protein [Lachnospiraceae bacterium]